MDFSTALSGEGFKSVAITILPGTIATLPFIGIAAHEIPQIFQFLAKHQIAFWIIVSAISFAGGMILEDVGSTIETKIDKKIQKIAEFKDSEAIWHQYLALKIKDEYIGQRYLGKLLVRLKFELSMIPSLLIFSIGLLILNSKLNFFSVLSCQALILCVIALAFYLLHEAYEGAKLLCKIRKLIVVSAHPEQSKADPA